MKIYILLLGFLLSVIHLAAQDQTFGSIDVQKGKIMKTTILLLGILLSVTTLMAQERTFKNFDIVKGEREYFIVKPKNYDNLLQSLKIDTLIFPQHKEVTPDSIGHAKYAQYEKWRKDMVVRTVTEDVRESFNKGMDIGVVIDQKGNYLSVYFSMKGYVLEDITEEQLQNIFDSFMSVKCIEPEIMDMLILEVQPTREQLNRAVEYLKNNFNEISTTPGMTMRSIYNKIGIQLKQHNYARMEFPVNK